LLSNKPPISFVFVGRFVILNCRKLMAVLMGCKTVTNATAVIKKKSDNFQKQKKKS
jgi:hypothetical protein